MAINSLKNKKILVTCGPTWVALDDTRVLSNISSGKMGHTLVAALLREQAKVTLLEGPVVYPWEKKDVRILKFKFYEELKSLFLKEIKKPYFAIIHAAAVSDYQPAQKFTRKLSSHLKSLTLHLVPTEKLITRVKKTNKNAILVGFKLQSKMTKNLSVRYAQSLIKDAGCDFVVANQVSGAKYQGFLINKQSKFISQQKSKKAMAGAIVNALKG